MKRRLSAATCRSCLLAGLVSLVVIAGPTALANATPSYGEMAAVIRSADLPCAHVLSVDPIDTDRWSVRCNSGSFEVVRGEDGRLRVSK